MYSMMFTCTIATNTHTSITLLGKVSVTPVNRENVPPNVPRLAALY